MFSNKQLEQVFFPIIFIKSTIFSQLKTKKIKFVKSLELAIFTKYQSND